jgi:hypothetical protein
LAGQIFLHLYAELTAATVTSGFAKVVSNGAKIAGELFEKISKFSLLPARLI